MGTLLLERGVPLERCLEELCLSEPDRIRTAHEQYAGAGARVIETNTFGANAVRLARFGLENQVGEINRAAAQLARTAMKRWSLMTEAGCAAAAPDGAKQSGAVAKSAMHKRRRRDVINATHFETTPRQCSALASRAGSNLSLLYSVDRRVRWR